MPPRSPQNRAHGLPAGDNCRTSLVGMPQASSVLTSIDEIVAGVTESSSFRTCRGSWHSARSELSFDGSWALEAWIWAISRLADWAPSAFSRRPEPETRNTDEVRLLSGHARRIPSGRHPTESPLGYLSGHNRNPNRAGRRQVFKGEVIGAKGTTIKKAPLRQPPASQRQPRQGHTGCNYFVLDSCPG